MSFELPLLVAMDIYSGKYVIRPERFERHGEQDAPPNNRPPSQSPTSSEVQMPPYRIADTTMGAMGLRHRRSNPFERGTFSVARIGHADHRRDDANRQMAHGSPGIAWFLLILSGLPMSVAAPRL